MLKNQTAHATAGNRTTITHGFTDWIGNPLTPSTVILTPILADEDADFEDGEGAAEVVPMIGLVSVDDTEMIVRASVASQTFDALLIYEVANENYPE